MSDQVIVRGPGEGRTVLVGGGDYITYKVRSAEAEGAYFCFEASTTPGFGPPLHAHAYRELFYVLEGEYEFTVKRGDALETITGATGTSVAIAPNVPHTFKNATGRPGRLLFVHQPAALRSSSRSSVSPSRARARSPTTPDPPTSARWPPRSSATASRSSSRMRSPERVARRTPWRPRPTRKEERR
jgi:quercetin dioxygenase-like cupin family protein